MREQTFDAIVDLVAEHEPVDAEDIPELLDEEIDTEQAAAYLSVAEERERVLEVNGRFWVMRVGPYSDSPE